MKCQQARVYLSPYLDSELDPTTTYEVARHLEGCPDCARLFSGEEELERAIGAWLRKPSGDEVQIVERALSRTLVTSLRLVLARALLGAAALLLLGLAAHHAFRGEGEERKVPELLVMAAADHRRHLQGEITPELASSDPAEVAAYFRVRLSGATGALPTTAGWSVEGARVCRFRDVPVGFVLLRYRGTLVSVVDVPESGARAAAVLEPVETAGERCFELPGGRGLLRRTPWGVRAAFGDVEESRLEEVLAAAP